ncbi:MAG: hypothetical protein DI535_17880 [Citrobacter freundii]|nr:MAG: hypothetical protein DI535_17880 [Citrobacter freundii]
MINRDTLVSTVAFIVAILGSVALVVKAGAAGIRYLFLKLYHGLFPHTHSKIKMNNHEQSGNTA